MKAGLIGLGVMGRNLALNLRDNGHDVVATDAWESARAWAVPGISIVHDHAALAVQLPRPRVIVLMVKAGDQVDKEISELTPHLDPGDVIVDGGNSRYLDTEHRSDGLIKKGIGFLGVGISGGAEGARTGAAIMVGGTDASWQTVRPLLSSLAAVAGDGTPTIDHFGNGGAGHFVKMVHNGIEYAIMQAIAECHGLMRDHAGLSPDEISAVFDRWATVGRAAGYLLEITSEIASARDELTGGLLLPLIDDRAGQKGTGTWTVQAAAEYGVPVPGIAEALYMRQLSGLDPVRRAMRDAPQNTDGELPSASLVDDLESALTGTVVVSLAQGLQLYAAAARTHGWKTDLSAPLRVWRAGSILRMTMLDGIANELSMQAETDHCLNVPVIRQDVIAALPAWRRSVATALAAGYPAPVLAASLNYVDALATSPLPTAMVQAQRDRFGDHGFGRTDRDGMHHGPWLHPDREAGS